MRTPMRTATLGAIALLWLATTPTPATLAGSLALEARLFTREQAQHGKDRYRALCGRCHGRELLPSGGSAPALKGPRFEVHWSGRSVGELYDRIRITMPGMTPLLDPDLAAALTAYILEASGLPAGNEALPTDREILHATTIPGW